MRPDCMQLYFLGHLEATICDIVLDRLLLSCLPVGCALIVFLNTWNLADQFSKLISNDTSSSSFESCRNRIPERGSPTCCCSRTLNYLNACLLQIGFASAGLKLPLFAKFLATRHITFFLTRLCCSNSKENFQRVIC